MLRKTPLVSAVAILSIALGIGANTAIFTLLDQVLFRKLPVPEPDRIVRVSTRGLLLRRFDRHRTRAVLSDLYRAARSQSGLHRPVRALSVQTGRPHWRPQRSRRDDGRRARHRQLLPIARHRRHPRPRDRRRRRPRARRTFGGGDQLRLLAAPLRRRSEHHRPRALDQQSADDDHWRARTRLRRDESREHDAGVRAGDDGSADDAARLAHAGARAALAEGVSRG